MLTCNRGPTGRLIDKIGYIKKNKLFHSLEIKYDFFLGQCWLQEGVVTQRTFSQQGPFVKVLCDQGASPPPK